MPHDDFFCDQALDEQNLVLRQYRLHISGQDILICYLPITICIVNVEVTRETPVKTTAIVLWHFVGNQYQTYRLELSWCDGFRDPTCDGCFQG